MRWKRLADSQQRVIPYKLTVGQNLEGRLVVFVVGSDGIARYCWKDAPSGDC
jgi:hypothetical protein